MNNYTLHLGDCLEVMRTMPDNSVDAIVCDPPYGLSFMGKNWDHGVPGVSFWEAALKVAKPGAMLLAFGGTRTHHRLMVAIEDAGWEIRDVCMWLYGSGFPKGHDVSKGIDAHLGKEREVIGKKRYSDGRVYADEQSHTNGRQAGSSFPVGRATSQLLDTAPATPEAAQWDGWNTNLKPAWEPIIMARKPLSEPTIAANVLKHGCGGINVDACRVGVDADDQNHRVNDVDDKGTSWFGPPHLQPHGLSSQGRWPANLILDEEAAAQLDEQSGVSQSKASMRGLSGRHDAGDQSNQRIKPYTNTVRGHNDQGGASRYFLRVAPDDDEPLRMAYVPKASRKDRNDGLEGMEPSGARPLGISNWEGQTNGSGKTMGPSTPQRNTNPCVKPTQLMCWLVRLITPPNGTVLDPFAGSGSTLKAAILEGFDCVGIELDPEYLAIAQARCAHALSQAQEQAQKQQQMSLLEAT